MTLATASIVVDNYYYYYCYYYYIDLAKAKSEALVETYFLKYI